MTEVDLIFVYIYIFVGYATCVTPRQPPHVALAGLILWPVIVLLSTFDPDNE